MEPIELMKQLLEKKSNYYNTLSDTMQEHMVDWMLQHFSDNATENIKDAMQYYSED